MVTVKMRWEEGDTNGRLDDFLFLGASKIGAVYADHYDGRQRWRGWHSLGDGRHATLDPFPTAEEARADLIARVMKELEG
jgi:hypothetical protein